MWTRPPGFTESSRSSIPKGASFLSRPRRFGKSLLVSTLKAIFLGERDVFHGLAIEKLPYDWKTYPVIHLDLGDKQSSSAAELEHRLSERAFAAYEVERLDALPLLYQTGYLTIENYDPETRTCRLDFPNEEVRTSFSECLVESFSQVGQGQVESHLVRIRRALDAGDVARAMDSMKVFFANIPYDIQLSNERYYQTVFHVVFLLLGYRSAPEDRTGAGRIDAVVETAKRIFIFVFKLHGTAAEALQQIKDRKYQEKYLGSGKEITLVGAAFDREARNIGEWVVEPGK